MERHLISRLGVANSQFHPLSFCPRWPDDARDKQLIPLSQAKSVLLKAQSRKRHSGTASWSKQVSCHFSSSLLHLVTAGAATGRYSVPVGFSLPQEEARGIDRVCPEI